MRQHHVLSTTAPDDCKKTLYDDLLSLLSSTCVIRVVLSVSYLFSFLLWDEFLKTYFLSLPHRSMCQSGRMKGFETCFKVEDTWRRQISMLQFCDRLRRGYKLSFMSPIWGKKSPLWETLSPFWG